MNDHSMVCPCADCAEREAQERHEEALAAEYAKTCATTDTWQMVYEAVRDILDDELQATTAPLLDVSRRGAARAANAVIRELAGRASD